MKKHLALGLAITLTLTACEEKEKKQDGTTATEPAAAETQQTSQEAAVPPPTTLTDSRDSKTYKTVKIGEQVWMAENLNYEAKGSTCYDNKPENCKKYGRLYDWKTAKTACPSGWKLPSEEEWKKVLKVLCADEKLRLIFGIEYGNVWWTATATSDNPNNDYALVASISDDDCGQSGGTNKSADIPVRCIQN